VSHTHQPTKITFLMKHSNLRGGCASLGIREQAMLHDIVLMADSIVRETFRVTTIKPT
jgi:hypothetical protein